MSAGPDGALDAVLAGLPRLAVAVSGGVDSMTLAHAAHRLARADRHDGARRLARRAGRRRARGCATMRRVTAGGCASSMRASSTTRLSRQPGQPLLFLQDQPLLRASPPPSTARSHRAPISTTSAITAPASPPPPSTACAIPSSKRGWASAPCGRSRAHSASATWPNCPRSPACRAASRPASRSARDDLAFIDQRGTRAGAAARRAAPTCAAASPMRASWSRPATMPATLSAPTARALCDAERRAFLGIRPYRRGAAFLRDRA